MCLIVPNRVVAAVSARLDISIVRPAGPVPSLAETRRTAVAAPASGAPPPFPIRPGTGECADAQARAACRTASRDHRPARRRGRCPGCRRVPGSHPPQARLRSRHGAARDGNPGHRHPGPPCRVRDVERPAHGCREPARPRDGHELGHRQPPDADSGRLEAARPGTRASPLPPGSRHERSRARRLHPHAVCRPGLQHQSRGTIRELRPPAREPAVGLGDRNRPRTDR